MNLLQRLLISIICSAGRLLLSLRYRVSVTGLDAIRARGTSGILILPNHPALIDPPIVLSRLMPAFYPRTLADAEQINRPIVRSLARLFRSYALPDPVSGGPSARHTIEAVLDQCKADLKNGDSIMLYPSGHIYRSRLEQLGGNSAVENILRDVPSARVVLVRTRGLWGSSFSRASGRAPKLGPILLHSIGVLLRNGMFFTPRRRVTLELYEPTDLPRQADRSTLNRALENWYNQEAPPNTWVPYSFFEKGSSHPVPEPPADRVQGDLSEVPDSIRTLVFRHLSELTGRQSFKPELNLASDLGLDSLARVDLGLWLEKEFGFPPTADDALQTVGDLLLAACGQIVTTGVEELKPIPAAWFQTQTRSPEIPEGTTIPTVFLAQARRDPDRIIVADQLRGALSYRDLILSILVLKPQIERIEGPYVGVLLPAAAGTTAVILAVQFAGKIPVLINWTTGSRNILHGLDQLQVQTILTSRRLLQRLEAQGISVTTFGNRILALEDLPARIPRSAKLSAWMRARSGCWGLDRVPVSDTAAVLFTSGSESLPKAVPLTHANLLANLRDAMRVFKLQPQDRVLGMLPPFHSFGLVCTLFLPLLTGIRAVYHPNPTEGGHLARLIEAYRVSILAGTPTFAAGILRAANDRQLITLRRLITGAEKCPDSLHDEIARRLPVAVMVEGYGITECSPIISLNDENAPRRGSIGKFMPSLDHVLVDPETASRRVPAGTPGLLLVRGPSIFGGYLNFDGASPFLEFEGRTWYRTGDLVREEPDGTLFFAGRLKRFVKIGGEMISLPAIEEVLQPHLTRPDDEGPGLAVIATAHESQPEIVLFTTRPVERETVNQWLRDGGLAPLYNIRQVRTQPTIPVLGTGKTDYQSLQNILAKMVS
jgi:acyl-CoA synthetase (AMP-forming)/AMP-acid ligase II/1-acyl-sn-glycerol-3-phosphate acyltransferase/acyl carrier protein